MKTRIVRIGKARGVLIPKALLEQCPLHGEVEINLRGGCLVVGPTRKPRAGWAAAFRKMAPRGDDVWDDDVPPEWMD